MRNSNSMAFGGFLAFVFIGIIPIASWIRHLIWVIDNQEWLFGIFALFLAPIGVLHGFCVFLGVPWF